MIKPYFMIQINQYEKCERPSSAHCFLHDVCFKKLEGFPFLRRLRQCLALDANKRHEYSSTADRAACFSLCLIGQAREALKKVDIQLFRTLSNDKWPVRIFYWHKKGIWKRTPEMALERRRQF